MKKYIIFSSVLLTLLCNMEVFAEKNPPNSENNSTLAPCDSYTALNDVAITNPLKSDNDITYIFYSNLPLGTDGVTTAKCSGKNGETRVISDRLTFTNNIQKIIDQQDEKNTPKYYLYCPDESKKSSNLALSSFANIQAKDDSTDQSKKYGQAITISGLYNLKVHICTADDSNLRLMNEKNSTVRVVAIYPNASKNSNCPPAPATCPSKPSNPPATKAIFTEKIRHSVIYNNLKTAAKAVFVKNNPEKLLNEMIDPDIINSKEYRNKTNSSVYVLLLQPEYIIQEKRSTLSIATDDAPDKSITLVVGAQEHLYLSVDALPSAADRLVIDYSKQTAKLASNPNKYYVGINWSYGDLYQHNPQIWDVRSISDVSDIAWYNRLRVKALFTPSSRPLDSAGIAIGYRFADGPFSSDTAANASGFEFFFGSFWTKGQKNTVQSLGTQQSWKAGISYGFDNILSWMK